MERRNDLGGEDPMVLRESLGVALAIIATLALTATLRLPSDYDIFLAYSSKDEGFARNLHRALKLNRRDVFFDKISLSSGEPFSIPTMAAAAKCRVALLLLSEEFFSSDWPMRQAQIFLQSKQSGYRRAMKIVPLFFKVSCADLKNEEKREKWFGAWCCTRPNDNTSTEANKQDWTTIVEGLADTSGMEFEHTCGDTAIIHKIVERVGTIARQHVRLDSEQPRMEIDDLMSESIPVMHGRNPGSAPRLRGDSVHCFLIGFAICVAVAAGCAAKSRPMVTSNSCVLSSYRACNVKRANWSPPLTILLNNNEELTGAITAIQQTRQQRALWPQVVIQR